MSFAEQQKEVAVSGEKPDAYGLPACPRCGSELTWGGTNVDSTNWGCLIGLLVMITKVAWLNLLRRPQCQNCGKISKFEIVSHEGKMPGYLRCGLCWPWRVGLSWRRSSSRS